MLPDELRPTVDDARRNLRADLAELEGVDARDWWRWTCDNDCQAWPAAIRRAVYAESECVRLANLLREVAGVLADEGETPAARLAERLIARGLDGRAAP